MPQQWSVWRWDRLDYDYYRCPGQPDPGGWGRLGGIKSMLPPRHDSGEVGHALEAVLPRLPSGCQHVGTGTQAVGRIAVLPQHQRRALQGQSVLEQDPVNGQQVEELNWSSMITGVGLGAAATWLLFGRGVLSAALLVGAGYLLGQGTRPK